MEQPQDFFIVGIGASAGGLKAVRDVLDYMPNDSGMAFVVVQHLSPDFKSLMPELLATHTKMQIFTAEHNQLIQPNCIYLNQRNKNLGIKDGRFILLEKAPKEHLNLPIDIMLKMLGECYSDKAIGVILSGTGSDGSRGIKTIKEAGGTIFVQDPESAQFDGMPKAAIATNLADYVLPADQIASKIVKFTNNNLIIEGDVDDETYDEKNYQSILFEIQKHTGVNFKKYKANTLLRRIAKRMSLRNIDTLQDYYIYIKGNADELLTLQQEFLIGVTSFFRDTEAFEIIRHTAIPHICQVKNKLENIRIWVAGCSTGKEVYSIAMLFDEYIRTNNLDLDIKIFATDVDKNALRKASSGSYSINEAEEIGQGYLDQYFVKSGERIQIIKRLREKVVFSYHDITNDPPFIQVDLIVCRNLLIYLSSNTQQGILSNFQFALNKDAFLFLGSSESLGKMGNLFKTVDSKHRIFQCIKKKNQAFRNRSIQDTSLSFKRHEVPHFQIRQSNKFTEAQQGELFYYKYLSKKYAPVTVFIDDDFNVQFIQGDFKKWFSQTDGMFTNNLLGLVPQELSTVIRNGIRRTIKLDKPITIKNLLIDTEKITMTTDLFFEEVKNTESGNKLFLVQFGESVKEESAEQIILSNEDISNISKQRIEDLEYELKEKRTELQNVIEELETSNEELQSSNEELMSSNEELQSSNEELQSVNEELYTVNTEFQEKNKELENLNNDMNNLLNSTDIGTLFLDEELNIRKFTPAIKKIFNLEDRDYGRSIDSFASEFEDVTRKSIIEYCQLALEELKTFEGDVCDRKGNWYLNRISPFITTDKKIEGVVVTFVNINEIKENEQALTLKSEELAKAQEVARMGSWRLDVASNEVFWTEELYKMYGFDPKLPPPPYSEHQKLFTEESWNILSASLEKTANEGIPYELELETVRDDNSHGWMWVTGNAYKNSRGEITHLRGIAQDITERKNLYEKLWHEKEFSSKITELSASGIYVYSFVDRRITYMNFQYETILGYEIGEINSMSDDEFKELIHPDDREGVKNHLKNLSNGAAPCKIEYRIKHKNGVYIWCYSIDSPFEKDASGTVTSYISVVIDISEKKQTEHNLQVALAEANSANIYKNQFLANMSHEIRTPLNGLVGFAQLLREDILDKASTDEYVGIIEKCSKQLLDLVNDILDLSKIEAGELNMQFGPCNLNELIKEVEVTFRAIKDQRNKSKIAIETYVPLESSELVVETDGSRLKQVLTNLVGNAMKFTVSGTIRFGYEIKNDRIVFAVSDTGIGMTQKDLEIIFERFQRVEHKDKKQYDGTGLGLAISKGIMGLLGGNISAESEKDKGSTFTIDIPFKKWKENEVEEEEEKEFDLEVFKNKRILIAEDNPTNKHYLQKLFEPTDLNITWANNGKEVVDLFKKDSDYSLILMDIRMPVMNGYEAAEAILEMKPDTRIIAQTANAMTSDKENCIASGFVAYVAKPVSKSEMYALMAKWIN
ncbi:MAG: histidine kinase [Pseudozobellia sp.]|nr:histidine kinase [Pseudozobellia sp.]|tara:strand:- start:187084 stop:191526 length:4443 start_codon:yes stop_codon:yes gene_type:complete